MSSSDGTAADTSWERSDGRSRPAPTVNTIRRIRQACTNCRCANPSLRLLRLSLGPGTGREYRFNRRFGAGWLAVSPAWGGWELRMPCRELTCVNEISRHRKTRCSGERPRCINCRRVDRVCHYEPYSTTNPPNSGSASNNGATKGRSPPGPASTSALFPRAGVVDVSRTVLERPAAERHPRSDRRYSRSYSIGSTPSNRNWLSYTAKAC